MVLGVVAKILLGTVAAGVAAAGAMAVGNAAKHIVIVIIGIINKKRVKDALKSKGIEDAIIKEINNCTNTVSLNELNSGQKIEVRGDAIDNALEEGDVIYVY